jgi:hypothetical protein
VDPNLAPGFYVGHICILAAAFISPDKPSGQAISSAVYPFMWAAANFHTLRDVFFYNFLKKIFDKSHKTCPQRYIY